MHMVTELHLSKYPHSDVEADAAADTTAGDTNELVEICRKLSRYMMYLLVTHPSILPLDASAAATLQRWQVDIVNDELRIVRELESLNPKPSKETLEEIKDLWILLLIYAASRSRPEIHAAQLARGGEPLTILWLLLEHYGFRSYPIYDKFELTGERSGLVLFQHSS
uniref:Uncharacterized protein n=1 Tax=Arundo donax TaxID=35708 RepID=A0A0A9CGF4_ARUDO